MPILRRSASIPLLNSNPSAAASAASDLGASNTNGEVFVVASTGEYFTNYEQYLERLALYHQRVWACRLTGHTGLTYAEAEESERSARKLIEAFPEHLKAFSYNLIHCSTDSIESLAAQISNFSQSHFAPSENVKVFVNEEIYEARVLSSLNTEAAGEEAGDTAEYRVAIISGEDVIGEAVMHGRASIQRLHNPPSKSLIKKFIRFSAVRYSHTGLPWLLNDDLVQKYNIKKDLDAELAERIRLIQLLKSEKGKPAKPQQAQPLPTAKDPSVATLKFPILDEYVPEDRQTDPLLWPVPKKFNPDLSIVSTNKVTQLLEVWQFIQAFSRMLEITPIGLSNLISTLEYCQHPNPALEAILMALLNHFVRIRRSQKGKIERMVSEYLAPLRKNDGCVPDQSEGAENGLASGEADVVEISKVSTRFAKFKRYKWFDVASKIPWYHQVVSFLCEISEIPLAARALNELEEKEQNFYQLPGVAKLDVLLLLRDLLVSAITFHPLVDKEVDAMADAKHSIRELEQERRKVVKEGQDFSAEYDEKKQLLESENVQVDFKTLQKELKTLDYQCRKCATQETALNKKIERLLMEESRHSTCRIRCLGEDRSRRRYWWMDLHLVDAADRGMGTGIVLVEEQSPDGGAPRWFYYDEAEQIDTLLAFLNPLGCKEARLGSTLSHYKEWIVKSMVPFAHGEPVAPKPPTSPPIVSGSEMEDINSDEDMPVVVIRRKRGRPARIPPPPDDRPEFLRYHNNFSIAK